MLWISASIFDKGTTPPKLLGQFMPIISREELLCSLICATALVNKAGVHCRYPHNTHVLLLSQLV